MQTEDGSHLVCKLQHMGSCIYYCLLIVLRLNRALPLPSRAKHCCIRSQHCSSLLARFGKSTHISMISNSVRHLRSYTNSAIADIAGNSARSPTSPHRATTSPHRAPISSYRMTVRSPTSLPQTQTSPHRAPISSHRMTTVSWCFTMF